MLNKMKKNQKGFTLIELIIVVAIIAILAAIAVPNFMSARQEAKWGVVYNDAAAVVSAFNVYNAMNDTPISDASAPGTALNEVTNLPAGAAAQLSSCGIISYSGDTQMWSVVPRTNQALPEVYGGEAAEG